MFLDLINQLRYKLQQPLPGRDVQLQMAHINREKILYEEAINFKQSAVLILLYPDLTQQPRVLLIQRSVYNGHHSGQIAFPGGKIEKQDTSLESTALREFYEETGCNASPKIIGQLSPVTIPVSRFIVCPFVAYLSQQPLFSPNTNEVELLLHWRLSQLIEPSTVKQTIIEPAPGLKINTPYFDVEGKILWGATAMMLNELKHILATIKF